VRVGDIRVHDCGKGLYLLLGEGVPAKKAGGKAWRCAVLESCPEHGEQVGSVEDDVPQDWLEVYTVRL
jgi:hypothetical protein